MDPLEGRFVLHGHLSEGGGVIDGALSVEALGQPFLGTIRKARESAGARLRSHHGPLVLRVIVGETGAVEICEIMLDRVMHPDVGDAEWEPWVESLVKLVKAVKFPPAEGPTEIIQP